MKTKGLAFFPMFVLLLFGLWSPGTIYSEDVLSMRRCVDIKAERISDIADGLSRLFQVPICAEESRWFDRNEDSLEYRQELKAKRTVGMELAVTNAPLSAVLDHFIKKYPEYQWEYDNTNRVINLYPKQNAPASWLVENINVTTQTVEYILFLNDFLALKDRGIGFYPDRGINSWMKSRSVSLKGQSICVRNVLNHICRQLPELRYWVIRELEKPGFLWDRTGRMVLYDLKIRPYQPFDPTKKSPRPSDSMFSGKEQ